MSMIHLSCAAVPYISSHSNTNKGEKFMKRILILALALVLALGLAVPAMAFTSDSEAD